ncbi:MAG: hypothetical protein ABIP95_10200 [Pelobium sp.]
MKRFKKTLRLLGLVVLIVLACLGIGIGGGVPVPPSNKKENTIEINVELLDADQDKTMFVQDIK